MGQNKTDFSENVAVLNDGTTVVPESQSEMDFLAQVANNENFDDDTKARTVKLSTLFKPVMFDINFHKNARSQLPTDLDPYLRQMIKEA